MITPSRLSAPVGIGEDLLGAVDDPYFLFFVWRDNCASEEHSRHSYSSPFISRVFQREHTRTP